MLLIHNGITSFCGSFLTALLSLFKLTLTILESCFRIGGSLLTVIFFKPVIQKSLWKNETILSHGSDTMKNREIITQQNT